MITVEIWHGDGHKSIKEFAEDQRILVGRKPSADICLPNDFVSSEHAEIVRSGRQLCIRAMGLNPTWMDGLKIPDDELVSIPSGAVITIRSFKVRVFDEGEEKGESAETLLLKIAEIERELYERTFQGIDFRRVPVLPDEITEEGCAILRASYQEAYPEIAESIYSNRIVLKAILGRLFQRLVLDAVAARDAGEVLLQSDSNKEIPLRVFLGDDEVIKIRELLLIEINERYGRAREEGQKTTLNEVVLNVWDNVLDKIESMVSESKMKDLIREECFRRVVNLSFGLGPLEDLLDLQGVTEILIVGPSRIYLEIDGKLRLSGDRFPSEAVARRILERAVTRGGRRIDVSQPLVDVQLEDGSRLNAVISPLSRSGDVLSIRRFRARPYTLQDLVENETMSETVARFLSGCILAKKNILIAGGTGSGKTTFLGSLAAQIDPKERIVIIEDTAEIRLPAEMHAVFLQTRPPNIEGRGEVTIRQLVRNALRMRPDRLIVGECRGAEVIDMLQAMNTGHPGSITTVHANAAVEAISRIEVMVLQGVELPLPAIRRQIADSIDLIVHLGRVSGGQRRVLEVAEVFDYDERRNRVNVVPIFKLQANGPVVTTRFTGWLPRFTGELEKLRIFKAEDFLVQ